MKGYVQMVDPSKEKWKEITSDPNLVVECYKDYLK